MTRLTAFIAENAKIKAAGNLSVRAVQGVLLTVEEFRAVQIQAHKEGMKEALERVQQLLTSADHSVARKWGPDWLHLAKLLREARGNAGGMP